jgi:hypothetical protein
MPTVQVIEKIEYRMHGAVYFYRTLAEYWEIALTLGPWRNL